MDVNKVFEDLLLSEDNTQQAGYKEGFKVGQKRLFEGYHHGYHTGSSFGAQLGYYSGTLLLFQNHDTEKVAAAAQKLLKEIEKFPKDNDENTDLNATFERIKLQFCKFCTLVKISPSYPEAEKLNF